jgi:hypothetical protein
MSPEEKRDAEKLVEDLKKQLDNLKKEKVKIENERISPERHQNLLQEQAKIQDELDKERAKAREYARQNEKMKKQSLKETIQGKLQVKRNELEQQKIMADRKLGNNQNYLLETILEDQEQLDLLIFENVSEQVCLPTKKRLQRTKDKLITKLSSEEIEKFCQIRTEISKLEVQQKQ